MDLNTGQQRRRLGWGYNEGLPVEPIAAAWGCRAIVHQTGHVDVLHDRQDAIGDPDAITKLLGQLNGGLNRAWIDHTVELLRGYEMRSRVAQEFTLLEQDGVVVKANTKGSGGYLYVCAYTLASRNPEEDTTRGQ